MLKRPKLRIALGLFGLIAILGLASTLPAFAIKYGVGDYGECPYSVVSTSCDISITNNGFTLFLNVTPTTTGSCTVQNDQVTVSTYDPAGYTLTLGNESTSSSLNATNGSGGTIPTSSGTLASPVALTNAWGYRVDGIGGFGSGPTTPETNAAPSGSLHFAAIQPSGNTPDTISSTSSLNSSVATTVWYGVCLNDSLALLPGNYTSTVLYTATAN